MIKNLKVKIQGEKVGLKLKKNFSLRGNYA